MQSHTCNPEFPSRISIQGQPMAFQSNSLSFSLLRSPYPSCGELDPHILCRCLRFVWDAASQTGESWIPGCHGDRSRMDRMDWTTTPSPSPHIPRISGTWNSDMETQQLNQKCLRQLEKSWNDQQLLLWKWKRLPWILSILSLWLFQRWPRPGLSPK